MSKTKEKVSKEQTQQMVERDLQSIIAFANMVRLRPEILDAVVNAIVEQLNEEDDGE